MKIKGRTPLPPPSTVVPFSRWVDGTEVVIAIRIQAVKDFKPFTELVKEPEAPWLEEPGKPAIRWLDSPDYKQQVSEYMRMRIQWGFLQALSNPENGFTWDKVILDKPDTWKYADEELGEWLLDSEKAVLMAEYVKLSGFDLNRVKELRDSFLSGAIKELQSIQPSQGVGQSSTQSSELANAGASNLQA